MRGFVKTAVIFIGLPYTGKTTLIQRLQEAYPGEAIYADEIFTRTVPSSEISLARWLQEGDRLVAQIRDMMREVGNGRFYIELGTMRAAPRNNLIHWCRQQGYSVIPIWCQCNDAATLQQRHQVRIEEIGRGSASGAKIDIRLDDLYARICTAFEPPAPEEGYFVIDTSLPADENLAAIHQLLLSTR